MVSFKSVVSKGTRYLGCPNVLDYPVSTFTQPWPQRTEAFGKASLQIRQLTASVFLLSGRRPAFLEAEDPPTAHLRKF